MNSPENELLAPLAIEQSLSRVLLIEDEVIQREYVSELLRSEQLHVDSVGTGHEGLQAAVENDYDLILLDLGLPDIDGFEVCQQLKARNLPVILITGRDNPDDKVRGFSLGIKDYINKPVNEIELRARIAAALRDVHDQKRLILASRQAKLRSEEELLRISRAVDSTSDAVSIFDSEARPVYQNHSFYLLFEAPAGKLLAPGQHRALFRDDTWNRIWETCRSGNTWRGEILMHSLTKRQVPVLCRASAIHDESGAFFGVVFIYTDFTERKRLESDLLYLATHDPLTHLRNRRSLCEALDEMVAKARRGTPSCVLYFDLDNFKLVNDTLGHQKGDSLLIKVAQLLRAHTREADWLARLGGDEFVLVLENCAMKTAVCVAEKLMRAFQTFRASEGGQFFSISASIGIAPVLGGHSAEELISQADAACHMAKANGRNRFFIYSEEDPEVRKFNEEANWAMRLSDGVDQGRFELWAQLIVPVKSGLAPFREALLRMRTPEGEIVGAGVVIPAAERFSKMLQLDRFVIQEAVAALKSRPDLRLSVNVSAQSIGQPQFLKWIEDLLSDKAVHPARLCLEITETAAIMNLSKAAAFMDKLQPYCHFALDDFGSGFSSLRYLHDLPVGILKIDGGFIEGLSADPMNQSLVRTMIEIGHLVGKTVVAEHVETEADLELLRSMDIDFVQGWYLETPRPLADLAAAVPDEV